MNCNRRLEPSDYACSIFKKERKKMDLHQPIVCNRTTLSSLPLATFPLQISAIIHIFDLLSLSQNNVIFLPFPCGENYLMTSPITHTQKIALHLELADYLPPPLSQRRLRHPASRPCATSLSPDNLLLQLLDFMMRRLIRRATWRRCVHKNKNKPSNAVL